MLISNCTPNFRSKCDIGLILIEPILVLGLTTLDIIREEEENECMAHYIWAY